MTRAEIREQKFPEFRAALGAGFYLAELAVVAAGYFGLAETAKLLPGPIVTPLWPPTGVAVCLVLLRGYRLWPAILVGSFAANATYSGATPVGPFWTPVSVGVATAVAATGGAWLINHWSNGLKTLSTPVGIAKFFIISLATAVTSTAIAMAGQGFADSFVPGAAVASPTATWARWLFTDTAGTVITASVILLWVGTPIRSMSVSSGLEMGAVAASAAVVGLLATIFIIDPTLNRLVPYHSGVFALLILLPLTWAGLRGNQRDAATAIVIFCSILVLGFSLNLNALPAAELNRSLTLPLALAITALLTSLIMAATIVTHNNAEAHLRSTQNLLTTQLDQAKLSYRNLMRHFQIFVDGVSDYAIFVLDTRGHVTSWNSNAQKIIGYKAEEVVGNHFGIFYRPDERRAGEPNRALELAARVGKHEVEGWRVRKNGTLFFVIGALTAIRDDDGSLIGFANIIRDATERRDAEEKLVETREQLVMAQKMEAIGKLTGGIAHDFNNLLMIIGGNAQIFKRLLDPKLPRAIEAIQTAAKRGESLTRQLLTFSRRQHLSPTVVDLNASIGNMRTLIESSLRGNIVYKEKIYPDILPIKVDLDELELAIVNIAVNSRDAMPNGGVFTLRVANVKADDERDGERHGADFVALEFSDTGMGVPPSLLSKIFDPFFTTKEVGKGTGLGLSQVYGFAHQAGGTVQAESTVGVGTTITVYLPSCAGEDLVDNKLVASAATGPKRPIVLIVDDSAEVAEVTSSLFDDLGYDTIYRETADAALKFLAEGGGVDLVFSDIVMPGMIDGVGLANEIQSRYPDLPVGLTTGYSDAAKAAPANLRILHKPFDSETLGNFIRDVMEGHRA